jgi:hypothetical protein
MARQSRQTFEQILMAASPQNFQVLENKARTAFSLAVTYPENGGVLRAIETEALRQMFQILLRELTIEDAPVARADLSRIVDLLRRDCNAD